MSESLVLQIVINDITPDDWQKLYRFLEKTDAVLNLSINEQLVSLNDKLHITDERAHPLQLDIKLADIQLQALVTHANTIRLVFSPSALKNVEQRKTLMRLISTLSRRLKKNIIVTPAGREYIILFSYSLETGWLVNVTPDELTNPYYKARCYIEDIKHHLSKLFK